MNFVYFPETYYINFFNAYFRLNIENKFKIFPIWGILKKESYTKNFTFIKSDYCINVCYLGQMTGGRLLLEIIPFITNVSSKFNVKFNFIGDGNLLVKLKNITKDDINIIFHDFLPSIKYEDLLRESAFGLVPISMSHGFPSYPSKILDFFARGIPIILITDAYSELNKIIESKNLGFTIVLGTDESYDFVNKINLCIEHYSSYSDRVRKYYYEHHSFDKSNLF
jgi:hypothetical protein